jgi:hypothetical protein
MNTGIVIYKEGLRNEINKHISPIERIGGSFCNACKKTIKCKKQYTINRKYGCDKFVTVVSNSSHYIG